MSDFPTNFDDDTTLPFVNDNLNDIGAEAINATRDAVFNIETEIGLGASGTAGSIATRLGVSLLPSGAINPSALTSLGLVTLPITNSQIENNANIPESKLRLDYRTSDLFNYIRDNVTGINTALGWISISGIKLEPHISGAIYRHDLTQIDINSNATLDFKDRYGNYRTTTSAFTSLDNLNTELLAHQFADGTNVTSNTITTNDNSTYSANYAHPSTGIFINTNRFSIIPETKDDLQLFAQYIDESMLLYGSRFQNLYSNGISKTSRSAKLGSQTKGPAIVPSTPITAYLLNTGGSSSPVDNIDYGDDIIQFNPVVTGTPFTFDTQFSTVKPGDIITVNYGSVEVSFIIKEKKFVAGGPYIVRIAGKNLMYTADGYATIDKPLFNNNKYGVLACAAANLTSSIQSSLIIGNPRNAMALGLGFNPDLIDSTHYLLYLVLYPTGFPADGSVSLKPIDVTGGEQGKKPGSYTLDSVVEAINDKFRQPGYNYRFIAFSYQGELGIMMSDCYNNASFSILSGVIVNGVYDQTATQSLCANNVVGLFSTSPLVAPDPFGFGAFGAAIASPPYMTTYDSTESAQIPTKIFTPLVKTNYYVNGAEKDKLTLEEGQLSDGYGDGYWIGSITNRIETGGVRVQTTYRIDADLCSTKLKAGKTITVQSLGVGDVKDFGRFVIESIEFGCGSPAYTDITVYDAVHNEATSPVTTLDDGYVAIYFNSNSVSFNLESATDVLAKSQFKRHFEIFIDEDANTFTHERGRININGSSLDVNGVSLESTSDLSKLNILKISPKLRGYQFGSVTKITLRMVSFAANGDFDGYLLSYDAATSVNEKYGPMVSGRIGEVTRFYDETNIDYIDILFDINESMSLPFATEQLIDFQLFPSLSLDDEIMMIATCQYNTSNNHVNYLKDERQFGNISEKELSTSAISYISLPDKLLHQNGVFKGFDLQTVSVGTNPNDNQIYLKGGSALVSGKIVYKNSETVEIPKIQEYYSSTSYGINWAVCVNDKNEYQPIPLLDYDIVNGTPNADRIFVAKNPVSLLTYNLDAAYFSDIVNNRKDLTLLYVVYSSVTVLSGVATSTLTTNDVRKYIIDGDANLPLRYDAGTLQGNYQSVISIFNWLKYNGAYNGTVSLRSASGITISDLAYFNILSDESIVIDGENSSDITFSGNVVIGSNVTFKNITLTFEDTISIFSSASNVLFDNCVINFVPAVGNIPTDNVILSTYNSENVTFKNCTVTADYTNNPVSDGGSVFYLTQVTDFNFLNSSLDVTYNPENNYPGNLFTITNTDGGSNINIKKSNFTGNFNKFIDTFSSFEELTVKDCVITSSYDPGTYGSFVSADLVNSGNGFIYVKLDGSYAITAKGILIDNVEFNFSPAVASNYRFSFINFELKARTIIENVRIQNCKFNNTTVTGSTDDFRAAIAIINNNTSTVLEDPPLITNLEISKNVCNRNQMIVLTSTSYTTADGIKAMYPIPLSVQNSVIKNNTCGAIGYWIGSGRRMINDSPNVTTLNNKEFGLTISENYCNIITNLDHKGLLFAATEYSSSAATQLNACTYPSSFVMINKNKASWISASITYETWSSLHITKNILTKTHDDYRDPYSSYSTYLYKTGHAISVEGFVYDSSSSTIPKESSEVSCIISNNIIQAGYFYNSSATTVYKYNYGGIYTKCSALITNNIINNAVYSVSVSSVALINIGNGDKFTIKNNQLIRGSQEISSYVKFYFYSTYPNSPANNCRGIVVDNMFDSPYTSGTSTNTINLNYLGTMGESSRWFIERNINQTVTRKLRILDGAQMVDGYINQMTVGVATRPIDYTNSSLEIVYFYAVDGSKAYEIAFELTDIIPPEVKLVYSKATVTGRPFISDGSNMLVLLSVLNKINSGTPKSVSYPVTSLGYSLPSAGETYVMTLEDTATLTNYINSINGYLGLKLDLLFNSVTQNMTVSLDEIEIKYRW